jgi:putative FmdB family regulatory protein
MPLYEYQCLACGEKSEVLQRFDDPPLAACPKCGGGVKKLMSSPAFQFKGSGFYATDYAAKKGGEPRSGGKSESDGASADSKSSGAEKAAGVERSERSEKAGTSEKAESKAESAKPKEAAASAKD